ncbi:MAG: PKD domain-containing protein [Reichenbachiella sp.]
MKRLNIYLKLMVLTLIVGATAACSEEDVKTPPLAYFTAAADANNTQLINFTNETVSADSYVWNFGDGETSVETSPSHAYVEPNTYTVTLTATNDGGDNVHTEEVKIAAAAAVNVLINNELDDDTGWTVVQMNENDNGSITFADGIAVFNEIEDVAEGGWDEPWAHVAMYQAVELEAGVYFFDMDVVTEGINETWLEVWIGSEEPVVGSDYNGEVGAVRAAMINAWDCEGTITYTGALSGAGCMDGTIEITEGGTQYVVLRGGGFNFGPNGISIDNLSLTAQ